jgi:hypothetical protein
VAGLIRVRSLAASRRRAGFAFTREPLIIGPESLGENLAALIALASIVGDPVLVVEQSNPDTPDVFAEVSHEDRQALIDMATAAELAADDDEARAAIAAIVEGLIGKQELQIPAEPEDDDDAAPAPAASNDGKADGGTLAAPAVDPAPASAASAASDEQSRAGADASAAPAADATAGNEQEATQQPPVADGTTLAAAPAAEAANPADAAPAAKADPDPEKGAAVPAEAKAKAVAKPQSSSGRKPKAAASAKG